jgi:predicted enzyme related to lactoylglutathione lyase
MFKRDGDVDAAGLMRKPDEQPGPPAWLTYLGTDDVDATVAKAGELGGTALMPGMDIPNVGRFAVLADPTGAVFALFKPAAS